MPIYEYHCRDCDSEFEKLMGFSEPNIQTPTCPSCRSENTRKRLSTIADLNGSRFGKTATSSCTRSSGFS